MRFNKTLDIVSIGIVAIAVLSIVSPRSYAASKSEMRREARQALNELYATTPAARSSRDSAKGVLVFPKMIKAGFVVGAQHGDGTLFEGGRATGYYQSVAGSYGLQAGVQKFGYAMFFMADKALNYLRKRDGWEVGSGPSVV